MRNFRIVRIDDVINQRYGRFSATNVNDFGAGYQSSLIVNYILDSSGIAINISATVSALSGMTGALGHNNAISGIINTLSGMTGSLGHNSAITGVINALSGMTGTLRHNNVIAGSINALSGMSGSANVNLIINGIINAISGMNGSLTAFSNVSGIISALSNMYEVFHYLKPVYVNSEIIESVSENSIILKGRVV